VDKTDFIGINLNDEEKRIHEEYKAKLAEIKKIKKENEAVGQVFAKGLLPLYVLYILSLGATNGNDISRKIGERTNGMWIPSTGGIYPILKKFEKEKLVTGKWDDPRKKIQKIYTLTKLGLEELSSKSQMLKIKMEEAVEVFKIVYNDLYNN
jgi:DNA-binding PadR family transcriptional regulator